jgi:hypothetical protein
MTKRRLISLVTQIVTEIINSKIKDAHTITDEAAFVGYNPLEKIRKQLYHWILVPFNGTNIFCQLRCPNATQIEQCGNITNIIDETINENKTPTDDEIIQIRNYQEALCKITFNIPTFNNLLRLVGECDFVLSDKKKELAEIEKTYNENKDKMNKTEREIIETRIKSIELQLGFILPDDTMAFITKWAMGNDISDIKKITKDMFLRAAVLAERYHKAPSDFISGVLTDFNKNEIDAHAVSVYNEFLKEQEAVNGSNKFKWFFGNRGQANSSLPKRMGDK